MFRSLNVFQVIETAISALQAFNSSDFVQTADSFVQPYSRFPAYTDAPFELPSVLVPPEVIELDSLSTDSGEDALVKKEEWAEYYVRLFDSDVGHLVCFQILRSLFGSFPGR